MVKIFIAIVLMSQVLATTFVPVTIKDQLSESDGVVSGVVDNIESYYGDDGMIYTSTTVRANEWMNINSVNGYIDVVSPGGKVGSKVFKVEGAPKFQLGEKVVLLTRHHDQKNFVHNLGLGKFSVKKFGKYSVLVNQIYPQIPKVGQIDYEEFLELAQKVKQEKFVHRLKNKFERAHEKGMKTTMKEARRNIASVSKEEIEQDRLSTVWLLVLLAILGGISAFIRNRQT